MSGRRILLGSKKKLPNFFKIWFQQSLELGVTLDGVSFSSILTKDILNMGKMFEVDQVKVVIWECDEKYSLVPHGFNFYFIKCFWDILRDDIMRMMQESPFSWKTTRGSNASFIAFVPKKEVPNHLGDYRPISLIGSLYNIIAKVLSLRLKPLLTKIIDETQSALDRKSVV